MSRGDWIVCERAPRWSSALRLALAADGTTARLRELRLLSELDAELATRPAAIAALEIHRGNFAAMLAWLPGARRRHLATSFAALLDGSLGVAADEAVAALLEGGAQAVASSPRRLEGLLSLGRQCGKNAENLGPRTTVLVDVWASLPWQES